jgi:hypothetical protein
LFPAGFANDIFMIGGIYTPPPVGQRVITFVDGLDNGLIRFGDGNLPSPVVALVTVTSANGVVSSNVTMKIVSTTGVFSGTFIHPGTGARIAFKGAVLQKQNLGSGYFLGTSQTGYVNFEPAP